MRERFDLYRQDCRPCRLVQAWRLPAAPASVRLLMWRSEGRHARHFPVVTADFVRVSVRVLPQARFLRHRTRSRDALVLHLRIAPGLEWLLPPVAAFDYKAHHQRHIASIAIDCRPRTTLAAPLRYKGVEITAGCVAQAPRIGRLEKHRLMATSVVSSRRRFACTHRVYEDSTNPPSEDLRAPRLSGPP